MRRSSFAAVLVLGCLVSVPAAYADYNKVVASILLTKTVGLGPGCASTNDITVPLGSTVTYCYTVGNTGNTNLMTHTLEDDVLGNLVGPNAVFDLMPGEEFQKLVSSGPIVQQVINTATWTAITNVVDDKYACDSCDTGTWTLTATSTAMATVTVLENANDPCRDGVDNNGNGLIDCVDSTCAGTSTCSTNPVPVMGSWLMLALALALLAGGTAALTARRRSA